MKNLQARIVAVSDKLERVELCPLANELNDVADRLDVLYDELWAIEKETNHDMQKKIRTIRQHLAGVSWKESC